MPTPISQLRNLGPAIERYCAEIGIPDAETLQSIGYMETYLRLRALQPRIMNRMALYALYGAMHDVDCMKLPADIKQHLNDELDAAKTSHTEHSIPWHALR
ncbi:MAG: competence protein TfoX [Alphaproteobacteria bacterium]|nr:competence protein TfoX [Alphaproteobacteria bacterium]